MSLLWLASYPKSGNTWLRAMLTSYLQDGTPVSINELIGVAVTSRELFDRFLGLPSSDMTVREILRYRSLFHELLAAELPRPTFAKVHDACIRTARGALFSRAATAGAIYLVRNPLDIAPSYAHHLQWSIGDTVARMNQRGAAQDAAQSRISPYLPQPLLTWSHHVSSWLEADFRVHVVRYEDMLLDPLAALASVVRFARLGLDVARLERAVAQARFDRLRAQEESTGFRERNPRSPSFFRAGIAGGWRDVLTHEQVQALVDAHAPLMERFGYLHEAEAFLAGATGPARTPGD